MHSKDHNVMLQYRRQPFGVQCVHRHLALLRLCQMLGGTKASDVSALAIHLEFHLVVPATDLFGIRDF